MFLKKIINTNNLGFLISLVLVSLPLYVVRCSTFSFCVSPIPFTLLEILILITFIFWLLLQSTTRGLVRTFRELSTQIPKVVQLLILIFLLSGLVASLVSPEVRAGLGIYKAYFIEGFVLFIVIFDFLQTSRNYKLIVWSLVSSGLWVAILAIANQIFNYNPGNPQEFLDRDRASAIYSTSNAVGLLLGPLIVLLFGYFLTLKNQEKPIINEKNSALISLIILSGGLISSGSRGAYLGIFAASAFFFSYLLYSKFSDTIKTLINKGFIVLLIIISLGIFAFFLNISYFSQKSLENKNNLPSSVISRICLWEGGVNIIRDNPITGSGLSGFQAAHNQNRTCSQENSIYPHNIFLNFWTEVGIFGLISFVGLAIHLFFNLLKSKRVNYLNIALAAVLVGILFHGLVDVPFFKNDLSAAFWALLALSLYQINNS